MPVQLQPPRLSDIDSWQGAFISSTSRLLLPACEVQYTNSAGQPSTKVSAGCLSVQILRKMLCFVGAIALLEFVCHLAQNSQRHVLQTVRGLLVVPCLHSLPTNAAARVLQIGAT